MKTFQKTITPLLQRVIVFLCIFVIITGIIGPKIINSAILFRDGFGVYGGLGKAMIFGFIAFVLLARKSTHSAALVRWRWPLLGWIAGSGILLVIAWMRIGHLLAGDHASATIALAHASLLLSIVSAGVGCFGVANIQVLARAYKQEIERAVFFAAVFYAFLTAIYALWEPLAAFVLHCVTGLLGLSGLHALVIPPNTLILDKFGITVAQYCSGIESIALFTGLYAVVGLLDHHQINMRRYLSLFPLALALLFGLNILRVFGLILAGYYINPQIAFSLFHTYAGMVFFILYSALFWSVAYKYILNADKPAYKPIP